MNFVNLFITQTGLSIRFALLRTLCVAAFVVMMADLFDLYSFYKRTRYLAVNASFVVFYLSPPVTLIHHVIITLGPRSVFPGIVDLLLAILELSGLAFSAYDIQNWIMIQWPSPDDFIVTTFPAIWVCVLSLLFLVFIRVTDLVREGIGSLWHRYDFTISKQGASVPARKLGPLAIFTGRALWMPHFLGETRWIIVLRAITAIVIILSVLVISFWKIIFQPIQEMWLVPIGIFSSPVIPLDRMPDELGWSVVLTSIQLRPESNAENENFSAITFSDATFAAAISVKALWPLSVAAEPCEFNEEEDIYPINTQTNNFTGTDRTFITYTSALKFSCRPKAATLPEDHGSRIPYRTYIHPDFLVSVNFSPFSTQLEFGNTGPENIIGVLVGPTDEFYDVIQHTLPTLLVPGVNLIGTTDVVVKQQLGSKVTALFLDTMRTFLLTDISHVFADPRPVDPALMVTGPDIATIRIRAKASVASWKIIQDHRDRTVLNGFANVGGLWTFLGGIFALFFGSSLLKIGLGLKPLSFFGAAHSLQKKRIRDACLLEYPNIERDIAAPERERGLLRMVCDHLLDVTFLVPDTPDSEHPQQLLNPPNSIQMSNISHFSASPYELQMKKDNDVEQASLLQ